MNISTFFIKARKGVRYLFKNGIGATLYKTKRALMSHSVKRAILNSMERSEEELAAQRATKFSRDIKISILVPLYNTPIHFLRDMIDSVLAQTYPNWELCLADGSDDKHTDVETAVQEYAKNDRRIVYKKLEKNLGISENTNACIDMATGDYIALFDHDDLLHQCVLFEVMQRICDEGADFVFTDEMVFASPNTRKLIVAHYKPDYAPDTLHTNNYICHFSVFSRALLNKVGKFRKAFDGSQDHDMILRLTEQATKIVHIPKLLYLWRSHPLSVAQSIDAKDYAIQAGMNAVAESVKRMGIEGAEVGPSGVGKSVYRVHYPINRESKVSILIALHEKTAAIKKCVSSIIEKSTFQNYEIIVAHNPIEDTQYLQELAQMNAVSLCEAKAQTSVGALINLAASKAEGDYLLLLDPTVEIISPDWMEELMMFAQREDVGATGAKLYYSNNTIAHAGIILGMGKDHIAGYVMNGLPKGFESYMGRHAYVQNFSAVTASCMMMRAKVFAALGGMNEDYESALLREVDLCLKARRANYLNVWTPYAEAYQRISRKVFQQGAQPTEQEAELFKKQWQIELSQCDPYYNPNFTLRDPDYHIKTDMDER